MARLHYTVPTLMAPSRLLQAGDPDPPRPCGTVPTSEYPPNFAVWGCLSTQPGSAGWGVPATHSESLG